jgi:hypothetical protein
MVQMPMVASCPHETKDKNRRDVTSRLDISAKPTPEIVFYFLLYEKKTKSLFIKSLLVFILFAVGSNCAWIFYYLKPKDFLLARVTPLGKKQREPRRGEEWSLEEWNHGNSCRNKDMGLGHFSDLLSSSC